ncbi:MAG: acyltransferase family protein, partial [Spirochaetales bacterium]|nr:acyltransferase family protein [Candidatus Physcosoma equi]
MRKHYLDNIRWTTVLLVVLYHTIYLFSNSGIPGIIGSIGNTHFQDGLLYLVYPWFMMILFLVAGATSRLYLENHTDKEYRKSRTRKLLVPSTLGILLLGWIQGYFNMYISHAFDTIPNEIPRPILFLIQSVSGIGVLWFSQLLWVCSILLILVRKMEKDLLYNKCENVKLPVLLLFFLPAWLCSKVLNTPIITVYRFGIYFFYFFLGYFVFSQDKNVEKIEKLSLPLGIFASVLAVLQLIHYFGTNYAEEPVVNSFQSCFYGYFAVLAILGGVKKHFDRETPFTRWCSSHSWGVYTFHYLPLSIVAILLTEKLNTPVFLVYFLCFLASLLGSILLFEIISRIPILRWITLGIKK